MPNFRINKKDFRNFYGRSLQVILKSFSKSLVKSPMKSTSSQPIMHNVSHIPTINISKYVHVSYFQAMVAINKIYLCKIVFSYVLNVCFKSNELNNTNSATKCLALYNFVVANFLVENFATQTFNAPKLTTLLISRSKSCLDKVQSRKIFHAKNIL